MDLKDEKLSSTQTVTKVYNDILDTYPFLSERERQIFIRGAQQPLSNQDPLLAIEGILKMLKNGHAKIDPVNPSYQKVPTEERLNKIRPTYSIERDILYIKIPSWNKYLEEIDNELISVCTSHQDEYKAILIDVRENGGGSSYHAHDFAGIFFREDIEFGKWVKKGEDGKLEENSYIMPADKNVYIDKPIAILISKKCFSSNELFLAPFKVTGRATLIGERTGGGSGAPEFQEIELDGKTYQISIPTHRLVLKGENKPIEETAIEPDIHYYGEDIIGFTNNYLKKILSS